MPIGGIGKYTDSSRRFVRLPGGEVIPRAQAENMFAAQRGYRGNYERRRAFGRSRSGKSYGTDRAEAARRGMSRADFDEARARVTADRMRRGGQVDKSPNGPLAKYLEAIGRRNTGLDYNVGETPSVR